MRTDDRPFRVGVFRDGERARRIVDELRANGLSRITVVTDDPNVQNAFERVCAVRGAANVARCEDGVHRSPGQVSRTGALAGAGVGLVAGFLGVALFSNAYGPPGAILNIAMPLAGTVWGAFIGAMISRGWQREPENYFDQELEDGEILVAVEETDPGRRALAERILSGVGVGPIPLPQG